MPDPADIVRDADDGNGHFNRTVVMMRVPATAASPPYPRRSAPQTALPLPPESTVDWQAVSDVLGPVALAIALAALGLAVMSR